ncbi:MAG: M50 family metallopeptidase [Microbacteriaceae bacterium]
MHSSDWLALLSPTTPVVLSPTVLAAVFVAAAALSIPRATWRWFGLFTTLVHELGHALAALLSGRVVRGVRVRPDHSGETVSAGVRGHVLSGIAGYPAPAIVGLAELWAVTRGWQAIAIAAAGVVLVLTLVVIRNALGVLVVLAGVAASAALLLLADSTVQAYALLVVGTALLVGAVRGYASLLAVHRSRRDLASSDAHLLARRTRVPAALWLLLFAVAIGGCWALTLWAVTVRLQGQLL